MRVLNSELQNRKGSSNTVIDLKRVMYAELFQNSMLTFENSVDQDRLASDERC